MRLAIIRVLGDQGQASKGRTRQSSWLLGSPSSVRRRSSARYCGRVGSFLDDTTSQRDSGGVEGRFVGRIGDDWSVVYAFGGVTVAAALRAMEAAADRAELRLAAVHAQFVSPVRSGPFTVDTKVLRMGRSVAQIAGELREQDAPQAGVRLTGTWAQPRSEDPVHGTGLEPPSVVEPGSPELLQIQHDPPWDQFAIHEKFEEWRSPEHFHPGALFTPGVVPEAAVWARLTGDCRDRDGRFELACLALLADRVPGPYMGPCLTASEQPDPRPLVSLDMTLRVFAEPTSEWMLLHSVIDHAGDGHVTTRVNIWDEDRSLVATSEQLARFGKSAIRTLR